MGLGNGRAAVVASDPVLAAGSQVRTVRWIRSRNRRHCARVGHKDALFHMAQEGEVPPDESVCYHCEAVLTECCNPGTCS